MLVWEWNQVDPFISQIWREFHKKLQAAPRMGVTIAHHQLLSAQQWDRSPDHQQVMRTLGAGAVIHSFQQLPRGGDHFEGVCWFRAAGRPQFDEREVELSELIQQEITRLLGGSLASFSEPHPSQLAPRVRQVLRCVLEGESDKQIATRLALSPHTVNQYTKLIYRHFAVSSRTELLARWIRRGWSTKSKWSLPAEGSNLLVP